MKNLSLKKLNLKREDVLQRNQQKSILGGYGGGYERGCCNRVMYNNGYYYSACNGQSVEECRSLVGYKWKDHYGEATVKECFCSDGHGGGF